MLRITDYDNGRNFRILNAAPNLFHKALKSVLNGEKRFHVVAGSEKLFDLVYTDNNEETFADPCYPDNPFFRSDFFFPPYYLYDEEDVSKLTLSIFDGYDSVWFENANEYTIVVAGIVLRNTPLKVFFDDEKALLFTRENMHFFDADSITIGAPADDSRTMRVINGFSQRSLENTFSEQGSIGLFHNLFELQWLTDLPLKDVKYAELCLAKFEGIGSLLANYTRVNSVFSSMGIETILRKDSTRYPDEMIEKYFNVRMTVPEMNDSNTIYINNFLASFIAKYLFDIRNGSLDLGILNPDFLVEMQDYEEAVIGDKKMLGLLIRGSDYFTTGNHGIFTPVTADKMLPLIHKWYDEDHYDGIFLATEDQDVLDIMTKEFPNEIRAISQQRYRVADLQKVRTIDAYDKAHANDGLEDTTVNYFYALYMLSKCDSFLASSFCNGVPIVHSFNQGRFKRSGIWRQMEMNHEL